MVRRRRKSKKRTESWRMSIIRIKKGVMRKNLKKSMKPIRCWETIRKDGNMISSGKLFHSKAEPEVSEDSIFLALKAGSAPTLAIFLKIFLADLVVSAERALGVKSAAVISLWALIFRSKNPFLAEIVALLLKKHQNVKFVEVLAQSRGQA